MRKALCAKNYTTRYTCVCVDHIYVCLRIYFFFTLCLQRIGSACSSEEADVIPVYDANQVFVGARIVKVSLLLFFPRLLFIFSSLHFLFSFLFLSSSAFLCVSSVSLLWLHVSVFSSCSGIFFMLMSGLHVSFCCSSILFMLVWLHVSF